MKYKELDLETLKGFRYPNLAAEVIESGYSICTLSQHMGYSYCKEDDNFVHEKVFGNSEITTSEAIGLAALFNCKLEYLFSDDLALCCGRSVAYWRHYETNKKLEQEIEARKTLRRIEERAKSEKDFFDFLKYIVELDMNNIGFTSSDVQINEEVA